MISILWIIFNCIIIGDNNYFDGKTKCNDIV